MESRITDQWSSHTLFESFSWSWFVCLAILGLAYYTNPSEKSFKRFLDQLSIFPLVPQQPIHPHPLQNSQVIHRPKTKSNQSVSKPNNIPRTSPKNTQRPLSESPKASFTLRTSHYNRHNLLLCTLISIDHSHNLAFNNCSNANLAEENDYPQLEWFLGCFDTWFALHRQILPSPDPSSIFSYLQFLKSLRNRWYWALPGVTLSQPSPTDQLTSSLKHLFPLNKIKKRNSHRNPNSSPCLSPRDHGYFTECPPLEDFFTSNSSGSEHDFYSAQASRSIRSRRSCQAIRSPSSTSGLFLSNERLNITKPTIRTPETDKPLTQLPDMLPSVLRSPFINAQPCVSQSSNTGQVANPPKPLSDTICKKSLTSRSETVTLPDRLIHEDSTQLHSAGGSSQADSCSQVNSCPSHQDSSQATLIKDLQWQSPQSSDGYRPHQTKELKPVCISLENQLKELEYKRNEEDLNKIHYESSLKHLNEIKDLKEFKRVNLDDRLKQSKSAHDKLSKQSTKVKQEFAAIQAKQSTIDAKFSKDTQQIRKEEDKLKSALRHNKHEIDKLTKANELKMARKADLRGKLASRQAELNKKLELSRQQTHLNRKQNKKCASTERLVCPSPEKTTSPPNSHPLGVTSLTFTASTEADTCSTNSANSCSAASIPNIPHSPHSPLLHQFEHHTLLAPSHDVAPLPLPTDPWAPEPWSEEIQQNNIRESFISLPNLEHSALKDHYPRLRLMDPSSGLHPFSLSPMSEEFLSYRHELHLSSHVGFGADWTLPNTIQTSPFGVIGSQGPGACPQANHSTVMSASLFRFPNSPTHVPPSIAHDLMARPLREGNLSRTSSSTSLSQVQGFGSSRSSPCASPYAPIRTPILSRFNRLDEVYESSDEGFDLSSPNLDYVGNSIKIGLPEPCQDLNRIESSNQDKLSGADLISRTLESCFNSTVKPNSRKALEGLSTNPTGLEENHATLQEHRFSPSSGGISKLLSNHLNSIFDSAPESNWPLPASSPKPKTSGLGLNPSAKAFTFGASNLSSADKTRTRGYSQSTVPSTDRHGSIRPSSHYGNHAGSEASQQHKSLHRTSLSAVVDSKSIQDLKAAQCGDWEIRDETGWAKSVFVFDKAEENKLMGTTATTENESRKDFDSTKLTGSPSELASSLSPAHPLPADVAKSACSGLFGPIGDTKNVKKIGPVHSSPSAFDSHLDLLPNDIANLHPSRDGPQTINSKLYSL